MGLLGLLEVADRGAVADRSRPGGWLRRRRAASRPRWSCRSRRARPAPRCGSGRGCSPPDPGPLVYGRFALSAMSPPPRTGDRPGSTEATPVGSPTQGLRRSSGESSAAHTGSGAAVRDRASVRGSRPTGGREDRRSTHGGTPRCMGSARGLASTTRCCPPRSDVQRIPAPKRARVHCFRQTPRRSDRLTSHDWTRPASPRPSTAGSSSAAPGARPSSGATLRGPRPRRRLGHHRRRRRRRRRRDGRARRGRRRPGRLGARRRRASAARSCAARSS